MLPFEPGLSETVPFFCPAFRRVFGIQVKARAYMERKKLIVLCPCPSHMCSSQDGQDLGITLSGDPPCQNLALFRHPGEEILVWGVLKIVIRQV